MLCECIVFVASAFVALVVVVEKGECARVKERKKERKRESKFHFNLTASERAI